MIPPRLSFRLLAALGAAALLAGCVTGEGLSLRDPAREGPFFEPRNIAGDPVLPSNLRRVIVLPVYGGQIAGPESAAALDDVVRTALQHQQRCEVVTLTREECRQRFGASEFSSAGVLPHKFLELLGRIFAVDAVLFVDLTVYEPYRPLSLGFRAKLATVQDVRLIWSFDEVFSSTNPAVVNSVRRFYAPAVRNGPPLDLATSALQSPVRFANYAADAMFRTLPAR